MFGFGGVAWKKEQDGQCTYNITLGRFRATIVAEKKAMSITHPECVYL